MSVILFRWQKIRGIVTEIRYNVVNYWDKIREFKRMRQQKTVNIKTLLENSNLAKIMHKGLLLNRLDQQCQSLFPDNFKGLYRIANLNEDSLIIEAANAAVRQGLLFRERELLALIKGEHPAVQRIRIKVNPDILKVRI